MINEKLNQLLSDYAVEAHKTHNFHWYVKGSTFFQVHTLLDDVYAAMYDQLDEVAELILMNEGMPLASMDEYLKNTHLKEAADGYKDPAEIFSAILTMSRFATLPQKSRKMQMQRITT